MRSNTPRVFPQHFPYRYTFSPWCLRAQGNAWVQEAWTLQHRELMDAKRDDDGILIICMEYTGRAYLEKHMKEIQPRPLPLTLFKGIGDWTTAIADVPPFPHTHTSPPPCESNTLVRATATAGVFFVNFGAFELGGLHGFACPGCPGC